ncbi:hypothetical protein BJV82DRAFT_490909, partial [Fennellomyces sp. T-0311]
LSSRSENMERLLSIVARQYPQNCGARPANEGPRAIIELYFENEADVNKAINTGLVFNNNEIIKACLSLSEESKILKIRLSELPFMGLTRLREGMVQSLSMYGRVLDCGIYRNASSGLFLGSGYATLDISSVAGEQPYSEMTYTIPWCTTRDVCYATWAAMPLHCTVCKSEGHASSTCTQSAKNLRKCWTCGTPGHISHDC